MRGRGGAKVCGLQVGRTCLGEPTRGDKLVGALVVCTIPDLVIEGLGRGWVPVLPPAADMTSQGVQRTDFRVSFENDEGCFGRNVRMCA